MIEVRAHESLADFDPIAMDELNQASARASVFAGPAWLRHFLAHDEDFLAGHARPFFLGAWEGEVLRGYLPLKARHDRLGRSLSSLITLEVERPRVVAAPADEGRVSQAFFRYLIHRADEWDVLELVQQDEGSPLFAGPDQLSSRHWLRRLPDRQNNVLALPFADAAAYASSLSKNMRHSTKKQFKHLLSAPGFSLVVAKDPVGRSALFEVFLELEQRSWKARAEATVGGRQRTYRAVLADHSLDAAACIACLDGLPVSGSVWLHYGKNTFHLQTIYAESHETLSPGTLMSWVTIADAIERKSTAFDMLPDFSHYKARWGAKTIDTQLVQLFRVGSLRHLKAVAGDFWRRVDPQRSSGQETGKNPAKVAAGRAQGSIVVDRARLDALLATAHAAGAQTFDAATLGSRSPFS